LKESSFLKGERRKVRRNPNPFHLFLSSFIQKEMFINSLQLRLTSQVNRNPVGGAYFPHGESSYVFIRLIITPPLRGRGGAIRRLIYLTIFYTQLFTPKTSNKPTKVLGVEWRYLVIAC
jgi:hypothetical protein